MILKQNPRLPLIIATFGLALLPVTNSTWPTIIITSFGLFLLVQSFTLKLEFTDKDLVVIQLGKEIRRFPFEKWLSWRIFLPQLPGLLYFREEASPHLLPIIFDREALEIELRKRVGDLEISKNKSTENQ
tara:strand:+ start:933 stop:1322 length:390 start_codon:yes stop_codon:yes gene_type:complete